MKIVVLGTRGFPNVQGGVENHCQNLYTHLARSGCDIKVLTRKPYVDLTTKEYKGVKLRAIGCLKIKSLEAIVHTIKGIVVARRLKPDILHIHAIGPSLFVPLAKLLGMKVVVTNHGHDYDRKKWGAVAKFVLRLGERFGSLYADKIICISKTIADDIKKKYGVDSIVIPNGVEVPSKTKPGKILRKYAIQQNKYILAVGRFVPEKGFDDLIMAFNKINNGKWKLVIAGDADHEDKYSRSLKKLSVGNDNVILTGFLGRNELKELYSNGGIFVLPSYHEGLPIVLLEAISYGLSCIASDIPANRNIGLSEDRFFEAGNANALAQKIKNFIDKPLSEEERRMQISVIAEKYDWEKIAVRTKRAYEEVL